MSQPKTKVKRVVLAYSGGLDTSIILKWLQTTYGCEVVTFTADLGQGEELEPARRKAELLGVKPEHIFIEDLREEFVRDYVFPMFRANAQYEGQYLLGTSIARPLIAKRLVEIAQASRRRRDRPWRDRQGQRPGALRALSLCARARHQDHRAVARVGLPLAHRADRLRREAPDSRSPRTSAAKRRSRPTPTCCTSPPRARCSRTRPQETPGLRLFAHRRSRSRRPTSRRSSRSHSTRATRSPIDGKRLSPAALLTALNKLGHDNGIGRLDLVENRYVGMKSRGMYETPGGTILLAAHRAIESITLDRGAAHLKDELMPKYAELIYNGFWFAPERELLQTLIDKSQELVAGRARLKLYKGGVHVVGRDSPNSLYDQELVTFEEGAVAYDHNDAAGFIKLNALRLRTLAKRKRRAEAKA